MLPVGTSTKQVAINAFVSVIEHNRVAISLGYGTAMSAAREADRAAAALYQAIATRNALTNTASAADQVVAELEADRWRQYIAVHSAVALQGALVVFNSIDLALKEYVRIRYGDADRRWVPGGPSYGTTPRTLFEIVRALCNYFRHREEWLVGQGLGLAKATIAVFRDLGIAHLSSGAHLAVLLSLPFDTWLDLESELVTAIAAVP